jgi:hypothetical protein
MNFFRCLIFELFFFKNADVVTINDETSKENSKKIRETDAGPIKEQLTPIAFTNFFRCLIFDLFFFTNADVVTMKDETSKENL